MGDISKITLPDNSSYNVKAKKIFYAECSTARSVAAKVVACSNFVLETGAVIAVRFTDTGTKNPASGYITLNINGTGAKNIVPKGNNSVYNFGWGWAFCNNQTWLFMYNGTYFVHINQDNNSDTKVTSAANHYTPVKSTTKSASGGTLTDITNSTSGTQVVTGVEMDAKGHVTGVTSVALKSTDSKVTVDSALSSTSTNPVQNKVINSALAGKAAASHSHTTSQISDFPASLPANGGNADTVGGKAASDFLQIADQMQFNNIVIEKDIHGIRDVDRHWRLWSDNEGGNFEIGCPDLSRFIQMDCFDNNVFRIYSWRDSVYWGILEANHETGEITLGNRRVSDFASGYGSPLNQYLNGQSGDIRTLVYQLPIGGYIFNTTDATISGISFPMSGDCVMFWAPVNNPAYNLIYGMLIIRSMVTAGATYICSVYNTSSYTDWQSTGTDGDSYITGEFSISPGQTIKIPLNFTPTLVIAQGLNTGFRINVTTIPVTNGFQANGHESLSGTVQVKYVAFKH